MANDEGWVTDPADLLRVDADFDLASFDRRSTPGWEAGKKAGKAFRKERGDLLSEMQERLFAQARSGDKRSVLLVVQGLDTAGKGGIVRHVAGMTDPQGLAIRNFGVPTEEEREHHYLWRVRNALPKPGVIGIFDRSHYEDVLVVRVDEIADVDWDERFAELMEFEKEVMAAGTTIVKVALMVSHEEQGMRLMERLDRPDKHWKYSTNDIATRSKWNAYQAAYADMLAKTSTEDAPWHVIPADRKWYARLAVTELLTQALASMDLTWPKVRWQVETQKRRLSATMAPETLAAAEESAAEKVPEVQEEIADHKEAVAEVKELAADDAPGEAKKPRKKDKKKAEKVRKGEKEAKKGKKKKG